MNDCSVGMDSRVRGNDHGSRRGRLLGNPESRPLDRLVDPLDGRVENRPSEPVPQETDESTISLFTSQLD